MKSDTPKIVTVSLSPCWDITCEGEHWQWGEHQKLSRQTIVPAGKALNVSRALSEMRIPCIAAGFWGTRDYAMMRDAVVEQMPGVLCRFTAVPGTTRQNITLLNRKTGKEMHLRAPSELANHRLFKQLDHDLTRILRKGMICVFAGAMPREKYAACVLSLIKHCRQKGAILVMDSSGPVFRQAVRSGSLWLIKPNVPELRELLGEPVPDRTQSLIEAAKSLLDLVEMILLSRGAKGALLITRQGIWSCRRAAPLRNIQHTVGGGDYLLAGFLAGWLRGKQHAQALQDGMQLAAYRIRGSAPRRILPALSRTLSDPILKTKFWTL